MFPVHSDSHYSSQRGQSKCLLSALRHSCLALFHFLSQHEQPSSILSLTNAATRNIKSILCKKTNVVGGRYFQNIRKLKLEKYLHQCQTTQSINYLFLLNLNEKIYLIVDQMHECPLLVPSQLHLGPPQTLLIVLRLHISSALVSFCSWASWMDSLQWIPHLYLAKVSHIHIFSCDRCWHKLQDRNIKFQLFTMQKIYARFFSLKR